MTYPESIGGYFELELYPRGEYHPKALRLNSGRNALEYILLANKYSKIYLPYYSCSVLLEPIIRLQIKFEYYKIDENLEPIFDFSRVRGSEVFLYPNYFGLKNRYVESLLDLNINRIIDCAQSFFYKPAKINCDYFYSPRKFFGVPDGAYLYPTQRLNEEIEFDTSYEGFEHLLLRIEFSPERGYSSFVQNEELIANKPMRQMSKLTEQLLKSIDYQSAAEKRIRNYNYLSSFLREYNLTEFTLNSDQVPLVYPFLSKKSDFRELLAKHRIYTPQYWRSVVDLVDRHSTEYLYAHQAIFLPIDQRYDLEDMDRIIAVIRENLKIR